VSASGAFDAPVCFAGYALHAPERGYDDLADVDCRGKVVVALRYEPRATDLGSPLDGKRPVPQSAIAYKAQQLLSRGAVALILVDGTTPGSPQHLPPLDRQSVACGLPVLALERGVAERWLVAAGLDLQREIRLLDESFEPRSRQVPGLRARGEVALDRQRSATRNVVFALPGAGALADQWVVLSAHYDHLGWGGPRSMAPGVHAVHNGADDNASGVAALLVAAEKLAHFSRTAREERRSVLFLSCSGEETMLAGSRYYVNHPLHPLERTTAVINMDMVGVLRDAQLDVLGADSSPDWAAVLEPSAERLGLRLRLSGSGYGPSDQTSFLAKGIPAVQLFTGPHERYHSPADDPKTINAEGGARIAAFAANAAQLLAVRQAPLPFAAVDMPRALEGDYRHGGASLGTIPDYASMGVSPGGMRVSDVRKGGPADLAGIRGGDVIVAMEGSEIENIQDFTLALRAHEPGDNIPVVVVRDGKRRSFAVTLGRRGQRAGDSHAHDSSGSAGDHHGHAAGPHHSAPILDQREVHLRNTRQLTFGGENAEAYFSPDGTQLVYQATPREAKARGGCDRIYVYDLATGKSRQFSSGEGRTTCAYFSYPDAGRILFASTHGAGPECPPVPDHSQGYVWPLYDSFEIYIGPADGSGPLTTLAPAPGYDAEATWCHQGGRIIFTSTRDGDIELYSMKEDGSDVRRLTHTPGYDGGAFYSSDCSQIVWRASRPQGAELEDYQRLLRQGLVRPSHLEIYVMDADGTNVRQLTHDGAANFGPYFHPSGEKVIYATNRASKSGREFDLFMVSVDGGEPERITFADGFDGFPMFSPDGRYLVWGSNRHNEILGETNIFIAEWVENPETGR
jgi:Tol biopolymer transport system component